MNGLAVVQISSNSNDNNSAVEAIVAPIITTILLLF